MVHYMTMWDSLRSFEAIMIAPPTGMSGMEVQLHLCDIHHGLLHTTSEWKDRERQGKASHDLLLASSTACWPWHRSIWRKFGLLCVRWYWNNLRAHLQARTALQHPSIHGRATTSGGRPEDETQSSSDHCAHTILHHKDDIWKFTIFECHWLGESLPFGTADEPVWMSGNDWGCSRNVQN